MAGIVTIIAVVLLAACAGAGYTILVASAPKQLGTETTAGKEAQHEPNVRSAAEANKEVMLPLEPILVSLEGTSKYWIRLEGVVAFHAAPAKEEQQSLLRQMGEDLLGYLRATPVTQIESPIGFEFLRDELAELVRLRSKGRARKFIIKALVIE
jgi:flagellar FliL protein